VQNGNHIETYQDTFTQLELIEPHAQHAFDLLVGHVESRQALPESQCVPRHGAISEPAAQPATRVAHAARVKPIRNAVSFMCLLECSVGVLQVERSWTAPSAQARVIWVPWPRSSGSEAAALSTVAVSVTPGWPPTWATAATRVVGPA